MWPRLGLRPSMKFGCFYACSLYPKKRTYIVPQPNVGKGPPIAESDPLLGRSNVLIYIALCFNLRLILCRVCDIVASPTCDPLNTKEAGRVRAEPRISDLAEQTFAVQKAMSALPPIATLIA